MPLGSLIRDERTNAIIGWFLVGVVVLIAATDLLTGSVAWALFWLFVVSAIAVPGVLTGDWMVIVPWPLPLIAVLAAGLRTVGRYQETAGFVAIATVALIVAIELDRFTPVDMSRRFVVAFAAMSALAVQAWWIVLQYASDLWLGTEYLSTQTELQWDIVLVSSIALGLAGVFVWYFGRFDHFQSVTGPLVPDESP